MKSSTTSETPLPKAPFFWARMLRFSIYYTIIGITLVAYLFRFSKMQSTSHNYDPHGADVDHLIYLFQYWPIIITGLLLFLISGIGFIIVSCIHLKNEKKQRNQSPLPPYSP